MDDVDGEDAVRDDAAGGTAIAVGADDFGADGEFAECDIWGAGTADPIEDKAVVSSIPTLVVAGQYDPITPPSWGKVNFTGSPALVSVNA